MMDEVSDDKEILCARAKEYVRSNETVESTPKLNKKASGARNNFSLCKNHHVLPPSWKDIYTCMHCIAYISNAACFDVLVYQ